MAINNQTYRGSINGADLAMAICRAYRESPEECELSWKIRTFRRGLLKDELPDESDEILGKAMYWMNKTERAEVHFGLDKTKWYHLLFIGCIFLLLNVCCLTLVRRSMKREMNERVNV